MIRSLHQAVAKVGVAVRADAVGRVEDALPRRGRAHRFFLPWSKRITSAGPRSAAAQTSIQPAASGLASEAQAPSLRRGLGAGSARFTW